MKKWVKIGRGVQWHMLRKEAPDDTAYTLCDRYGFVAVERTAPPHPARRCVHCKNRALAIEKGLTT